MDFIERSSQPI